MHGHALCRYAIAIHKICVRAEYFAPTKKCDGLHVSVICRSHNLHVRKSARGKRATSNTQKSRWLHSCVTREESCFNRRCHWWICIWCFVALPCRCRDGTHDRFASTLSYRSFWGEITVRFGSVRPGGRRAAKLVLSVFAMALASAYATNSHAGTIEIGRASCRERVCAIV